MTSAIEKVYSYYMELKSERIPTTTDLKAVEHCLKLLQEVPVQSGWICVKERLPHEYDVEVLATWRNIEDGSLEVKACLYNEYSGFYFDHSPDSYDSWEATTYNYDYVPEESEVTHWQYFPDPDRSLLNGDEHEEDECCSMCGTRPAVEHSPRYLVLLYCKECFDKWVVPFLKYKK